MRQGDDSESALLAACAEGSLDIICFLFELGADTNATGGKCGLAPQAACVRGSPDIVHLLFECGADINGTGGCYGYGSISSPMYDELHR